MQPTPSAVERRAALVLVAVAALPLLSLLAGHGPWLGVPGSELPVKIWSWHTFPPGPHLLGGPVPGIAFPVRGVLDNADVVGSLVIGALWPLLGGPAAWATLLYLQLLANALAMFVLVRGLTGSARAGVVGGAAWALAPFTLTYGVASSIADVLNLWPYPLVLHYGLRALGTGWRDGVRAGLLVGVGFATCAYNVLVFAPLVLPILAGLGLARGRLGFGGQAPAPRVGAATRAGLGLALGLAAVALPLVLARQALMDDTGSLMSAALVDSTRHVHPYPSLHPITQGHYAVPLAEYLAVGKDALSVRENAARFLRAYNPGLVVLALAVLATLRGGRRRGATWPWWGVVAFFALASTGPYLVLSGDRTLPGPWNLVWLGLHHGFPGSRMLLEPFRYALAVALGASVLAGFGASVVVRRWGTAGMAGALGLILLDLALLSPVPVPLPTQSLPAPPWAGEVDALMGPGAILELPFTRQGTGIYNRDHFSRHLAHGRPIPDEVRGSYPRFIEERPLLRELVDQERAPAHKLVTSPLPGAFGAELGAVGIAAVVLRPALYASPAHAQAAQDRLAALGAPLARGEELIYVLSPP